MNLRNYRTVIIIVAIIGVLLFASPTIAILVEPPNGEPFSVIYILGPSHTMDNIPFNIRSGTTYSVYLGVINNMGSSMYYTCSVKLASQKDPLPDPVNGTPSSLSPLYEYKTFLTNGQTWETPLTFQVNKITFATGASTLSDISINGVDYSVNKVSAFDSSNKEYTYRLIVELSTFNPTHNAIQYEGRFVTLNLNITQ